MTAEQSVRRQQADTHEQHKAKREWFTFGALVLAAFAAVLTVVVSHRDVLKSLREAHATADQQHADTLEALKKTDTQIAALRKQLTVSIASEKAKLKVGPARIQLGGWPPDFGPQVGRVKIRLQITNTGRAAGIITRASIAAVFDAQGKPLPSEPNDSEEDYVAELMGKSGNYPFDVGYAIGSVSATGRRKVGAR